MLSEFKARSTVYKGKGVYKVKIILRFMTLYQILNKAKFDDVFKDIVSYVPEVVEKKEHFLLAFETLRSIKPCKGICITIQVNDKDYLGKGVHDIWVNASDFNTNIWGCLVTATINRCRIFESDKTREKITDEQIVADLLWHLVALGYPEDSSALIGYIFHNCRWPETTKPERIEEICSYMDSHKVLGIYHDDIRKYIDARNITWIADMTSYSLPKDKAAYDLNCCLDDFMWFNEETKTYVIISASPGYETEVNKIEEFVNNMMRNPTILYGTPKLPGIEVMAVFITD